MPNRNQEQAMVERSRGERRNEEFEEREDYQRAAETVRGQLMERGIDLSGDENGGQLISLLEAVQQFERAVAERGGDSMTNALDSADPPDPDLVLPRRREDESLGDYANRVEKAAARLRRSD